MKTIDEEMRDLRAAIAAVTTLEDLAKLEEQIAGLGGGRSSTVFMYARGDLFNAVANRAHALLNA